MEQEADSIVGTNLDTSTPMAMLTLPESSLPDYLFSAMQELSIAEIQT